LTVGEERPNWDRNTVYLAFYKGNRLEVWSDVGDPDKPDWFVRINGHDQYFGGTLSEAQAFLIAEVDSGRAPS
jgi:hypothetical protein